jgi:hypothetical protein
MDVSCILKFAWRGLGSVLHITIRRSTAYGIWENVPVSRIIHRLAAVYMLWCWPTHICNEAAE